MQETGKHGKCYIFVRIKKDADGMYNQVGTESVTLSKSIIGVLLLYKSVHNVFNIYHTKCLKHIQCIHYIILVKRQAKSCDPKQK